MHEKKQYSSSQTCQNGNVTPEKERFLRINKVLAALLVLLVCLLSANAALAWLSDQKEISNEVSISDVNSKSYASIIKPADGSEKTILVFGRGEPTYSPDEVVETYYEIESLDGSSVPWKDYIADIESVIIDGAISPSDMTMWFVGATKLTSLDLTGISAENLVSSSGMLDGCDHLEQITIPPTFHFVGSPSLPSPDPSKIDDADGHWYLLDEAEAADEGMSPEDAAALVDSRYGSDEATTIYAYGRGYAAVYGNTTLVFGRGVPAETYDGMALNAAYRGIETVSEDFNQKVPWSTNIQVVKSIATHPIPTPTIKDWFKNRTGLRSVDFSSIDLANCADMTNAFYNCSTLNDIDTSYWKTGNVKFLTSAFYNCRSLEKLDVSNWDTSNMLSISMTFMSCSNLSELDVSNWDVSKLGIGGGSSYRPLSSTFDGCSKLAVLDLSNWHIVFEDAFFAGSNNITRYFVRNCSSLKELDLSGFVITEQNAIQSNRNYWDFTGCGSLEKIVVPSTFCSANTNFFPTPDPNRDGIVNSYYWYEEGEGSPLTCNEASVRVKELYDGNADFPTITTFYSNKLWTDDDTYAAYYVGGGDNVLVFGRGAKIPETYEGATLSNGYREIETKCGGSQNDTPWYTINRYMKRVVIGADLVPQNCGYWFASASQNTTITGLDRLEMSECKSAERMFYLNQVLTELNIPAWNFASCETFSAMFESCQKLTELRVDGWTFSDRLRSDAFHNIFRYVSAVTELDLSSWSIEQSGSSAFSFNDTFSGCQQLQKLSFPHLIGNASPASGNVRTNWYFGGTFYECGDLCELVVPNDFSFSSVIIPNGKDGLNNVYTGGRWYLDKQGDGKSAELLQNDLLSRFKNGSEDTHWYIDKNWTDDDAYAAFYGDLMLFDRSATIADSIDGKNVGNIYREIEAEDYIAQWAFTNSSYPNNSTTTVRFNSDIYPCNLANYFKNFVLLENVENIESLKTINVSNCFEMFSYCRALRSIDISHFDMSSATNFEGMFYGCLLLEDVELFNIDATQDHTFRMMFASCSALTKLDFSGWNMPKWNNVSRTERIINSCSSLEEITVSPTFNFSMMADGASAYGVAFPESYNPNGEYLYAPLWYKNGQGRGYAYYDADDQVNATYGEGTDPITWTRHPLEEAYAAIYKTSGTENYSLIFGRGLISDLKDSYFGHELVGVALGYEEYSFYEMQRNTNTNQPWSPYAASITEVIVKDEVKPVSMQQWFSELLNCTIFSNIDRLNTSNCTDLWGVFNNCRSVEELDLSSWDTSKVKRYGGGGYNSPFYNCLNLKKISLAGWNLSSLTTKNEMFSVCPALEEIDMSGCVYENAPTLMSQCFKLRKVIISPEMSFAGDFFSAGSDINEGFDGKWYLESDLTQSFTAAEAKTYINDRFRTSNDPVTLIAGYGTSAYAAVYKNPNTAEYKLAFGRGFADSYLDGWGQEAIYRGLESNIYNSFGEVPQNSSVPWKGYRFNVVEVVNKVPVDDPIKPLSLNSWFYEMSRIPSIDMSMFDVISTNDIANMLYGCSSLSDLRGLASWNVSNVETMSSAFAGVVSDFSSSIRSWDTPSLKNMSWLFWNCTGLTTLDLSGWDTTNLTSNVNAFYQCTSLKTLSLPKNFVKASMANIGQMFLECRALTSVDTTDWDTSGLTTTKGLFQNCYALSVVRGIESWDVSNVVNMDEMFRGCYVLSAYCNQWNVENVTSYTDFAYLAPGIVQPSWPQTASLQSEDSDPVAQAADLSDSQSDSLAMTSMANYAPERYVVTPVESKQINAVVKLEPVSGNNEGIGDR